METTGNSYNEVLRNDPNAAELALSLTGQMNAELPNEIYFAFDKAILTSAAQSRLNQYASWMVSHPGVRFSVIGHADAVGSNAYNEELGMKRAQRAVAYLMSRGVSYKQLYAMVSLGEQDPRIPTEKREVLNRRVVIEVQAFLKKPIEYQTGPNGLPVVAGPQDAVNTEKNVCGGGMASLCADAVALNMLGFSSSTVVNQDLSVDQSLSATLDTSSPTGSVSGSVEATVNDVGGAVGGTVDKVESTVKDTTGTVKDTVGGLL